MRDLPDKARRLLATLKAPPRLVAHLTLVHDAASELLEALLARWPDFSVDRDALLFGAAVHDIGKVLHPDELFGAGHRHEQDGPALLGGLGVTAERARFARTHGTWMNEPSVTAEDLIVALADHCWKGSRHEELESQIASRIADSLGIERWEVFLTLDDILTKVANGADERLAWQRQVGG
ncbi:MAG TPA: HD domain-containing protein [Lacipirellulaceae bacterium]|nr:HD domain-containing protein [Lacipirellulaceae bacterium]